MRFRGTKSRPQKSAITSEHITRIRAGYRNGPLKMDAIRGKRLFQHLAQDVLEDAAVLIVGDLLGSVHAGQRGEGLG